MAYDPALAQLGGQVEEDLWPRPVCPICFAGHLRFAKPEEVQDAASKHARDHPDWEPEWISGVFSATATCENPACGQPVVAVGTYLVNYAEKRHGDSYQGADYSKFYKVQQVTPPIPLIRLPTSTPVPVQDGVNRASNVLFADPGLAATALRLVVEQFLTSEGVPDKRLTGGFISADERIKTWKQGAADRGRVAGLLLAAKWIGNAGTHSLSTLSVKEVLDGVEFLDEAFHALFVGPDIETRAKAINAARGPVPPPKV